MESSVPNICANCGKGEEESNNLKTCTACKLVKYCNRDCQIAHRSQHKKACKKRVAELRDEQLFKEVEREECPICLLTLPIDLNQTAFESCCGKNICNGCRFAMFMSEEKDLCAFCRTPPESSDEEQIKRLKKLMAKGNGDAFAMFAGYYVNGTRGLPQDYQKAIELFLKSGELGCASGYYNLGVAYDEGRGVEVNMKKAKYYWELAAMNGSINARHNLGSVEGESGNYQRALKHMMISATAGHEGSVGAVKVCFQNGMITKDGYENVLRAYQQRKDEMKSDERDKARDIAAADGVLDGD